jgi:hypothetical protein
LRECSIVLAGMRRIEIGDAVDAEDDGLAIEHEPLLPDLARGLGDPGISLGPVIAATGDQAHAVVEGVPIRYGVARL